MARRRLDPARNRILVQRSFVGAILLTAFLVLVGVLFGGQGTFDRMSCMLPIGFILNFGLVYSIQFGREMNRTD